MAPEKIKFKQEIESRITSGAACAFIDHVRHGEKDCHFVIGNRLYYIIEVVQCDFYDWAAYYYSLTGFGSEFEAMKWRRKNYPKDFDKGGSYIAHDNVLYLHYFGFVEFIADGKEAPK